MHTVSSGDSLHEMSNPVFWQKKKNINLSSAKLAKRVIKLIGKTVLFTFSVQQQQQLQQQRQQLQMQQQQQQQQQQLRHMMLNQVYI